MRLLDLFDRFLLHLEHERRCSLGTIQAYRRDFLQFLAWLDRTLEAERAASIRPKTIRTHELTHLTTERVRSWQVSLSMERKLATGAIRRKLYALGAFCKFLVGTGAMGAGQNPMAGVVAPKRRRRVRRSPSLTDWRRVMELPVPPREHAIRAVFALTGIRREELLGACVGDLRLETAAIASLVVRGKGDKERVVPVPQPLREILWDYLLRTGKTGPRERVFTNPDGSALSPSSVNRMVARWGRSAGFHLFPHAFRHAYATFLLSSGVKLPVVQEWLGHEDLATTASYLHAAHDPDDRRALETFAGSVRVAPALLPSRVTPHETDRIST